MKKPGLSVAGKVLCSALSAAMVIAFAPAIGTAVGSSDAQAYADASGGGSTDNASDVEEDEEDYGDLTVNKVEANDASSFSNAISSASTNDETVTVVKLTANIELSGTVSIDKRISIDLNGHNITAKGFRALHVKSNYLYIGGKGTISANKSEDSNSFEETSSVIRVGDGGATEDASLCVDKNVVISSDHCYGVSVFGKAETSLDLYGKIVVTGERGCVAGSGSNGTAEANIYLNDGSELSCKETVAVYHPHKGTLTLGSTKITGPSGIEVKAGTVSVEADANPVITATEKTATHNSQTGHCSTPSGYAVSVVENQNYLHRGIAQVYLSGGTYTGAVALLKDETTGADNTKIKGYSDQSKSAILQVTGGTYDADPSKVTTAAESDTAVSYVPTGYKATQSGGKYTVAIDTASLGNNVAVVRNNDGSYKLVTNLSEAFVTATESIKLLKDVTDVTSTLTVPAGASIKLDLNGKKISGSVSGTEYNNGGIIKLAQAATTSNDGEGETSRSDLTVCGGGTIENKATGYAPVFIALADSFLTIENGTFTTAGYGLLYAINSYVNIEDGTFDAKFTGGDLASQKSAFYIMNSNTNTASYSMSFFFENGALAAKSTYGIYVDGGAWIALGDEEKGTGPNVESYWSAIARGSASTCHLDVYGGTYTAGHTSTKTKAEDKENSVVYLPGAGEVEISGGTFTARGSNTAAICIPKQNVSLNLTINGGTFDASNGDAILRTSSDVAASTSTNANTLSITGGTFKGAVANFITSGSTTNGYSKFISGGTFTKQPASSLLANGYTANYVNGAYTVAKASHVHKYSYVDTKAATCTEAGVRTYTCEGDQSDSDSKGCGTSYTEPIKALGHNYTTGTITWTDGGTSAATAKFTCSRDAKHTETVNATITKKLTKKPTCTEKGTNTYTATAKSSTGTTITATKTAQDEPATGHEYGPYTVTKQPTTTATGVATAKCTHEGCTSTITKTVAKLASDEKTSAGGTSVTVKVDDAKPVTTPSGTQAVGSVTIAEVSAAATKVSIPETVTINGAEYAVEAIDAKTFAGNTTVTSVTVPDTVKTIAEGQFKDCSKLTSVTLPSAITEIPADTFAGTALTSVTVPSKVTSIGAGAFQGTKLTSVTLPASVTTVGASAFADTEALKSVTLPESVKTVGESAFAGSAVEEVKLPTAVTTVAADTFKNCTALKTVEAAKATTIEAEAFKGCSALTSVKIDSATSIGASAFAGTTALKSVTLPESVKTVGAAAFAESGIVEVKLPAAVTAVETDTFKDCAALTTVDAPAVETIGESALSGCTALKTVNAPKATAIAASALSGCTVLTELAVESVQTIGAKALEGCTALKSVEAPKATTIGEGALAGCSALKTVKAPEAKTVAANAFKDCTALKTVSVPKVTSIASNAFKDCAALKTVTASKVKTIAANALVGCTSLKKLTTGTALKSIGKNAFKGDSSLKTLTITSKKLSKKAVKGCLKGSSITTIVVKVSGSAKTKAKYLAAYKKAFAKSNSGKKVAFK